MGLSRRNTLIGLGAVIAGGGAAIGTGAFTTVTAERTVSVETADDADALLALSAVDDDGQYVEVTDGTIEINLDGGDNADGINQNARTRFENLVQVTNNGDETVDELSFEFDVTGTDSDADHESALGITYGDETLAGDGSENLLGDDYADSDLGIGDSVPFGIEVDLLDTAISDIDDGAEIGLLISAESTEA